MNAISRLLSLAIFLFSSYALGFDMELEPEKEGLSYAGVQGVYYDFRSLGDSKSTAELYGASFNYGTYLTDWIKTEFRAGTAFDDDSPIEGLEISIDYYVSWYLGVIYPVTEWATFYGMAGATHIKGDATVTDEAILRIFPDLDPDDLYNSSFSFSWMVGADWQVYESYFLTTELGSIHKDSQSDISTLHFSAGLKYEF